MIEIFNLNIVNTIKSDIKELQFEVKPGLNQGHFEVIYYTG